MTKQELYNFYFSKEISNHSKIITNKDGITNINIRKTHTRGSIKKDPLKK